MIIAGIGLGFVIGIWVGHRFGQWGMQQALEATLSPSELRAVAIRINAWRKGI